MAKTDWKNDDIVKAQDMNDIGEEINNLRTDIDNIHIPDASLTEKGITQLSSATDSTAEDRAATPKAVKAAYDLANNALPKTGGTVTGDVSIVGNAGTLDLVGTDHVFMELFPKGRGAGRKGYIGFPAADTNNIVITNENVVDGDVIVFAKGQNISISDLYKSRGTRVVNDLNNITENGIYDGDNAANAPGTGWYYVENIVHSADPSNWRLQRATGFYDGVTYWRQLRAGTWTAWQTWGGGVKKVSRYSIFLDGGISKTKTIPAVDVNKTSINVTGFYTAGYTTGNTADSIYVAVELTNATTVTASRASDISTNYDLTVHFEVIEYN